MLQSPEILSCIGLILINSSHSAQSSCVVCLILMVVTIMKTTFQILPPNIRA